MESNFKKTTDAETVSFGTKYDYGSVMHYGKDAFANGAGKLTIVTKDKSQQNKIGQRNSFSATDLKKLKAMYKCP